jgi:hypothetical protein
MRFDLLVSLLLLCLGLSGCSTTRAPQLYLSHFDLKQPQIDDFETCAAAGCRQRSRLAYSESEWHSLRTIFVPAPVSAAEERERLRVAIAAMEVLIGEKNDTSGDNPKNQRRGSNSPQLDCIAETANTTVALLLLKQDGLIRYHRVSYPQHRGFIHLRFPHNTAALFDLETGEHFALDSWFFANGEPPICVPVAQWKAGYCPDPAN